MISQLSSFIEVILALYATIWIDKKFQLKIWQPDISPALNSFLEKNTYWVKFALIDDIKRHVDLRMSQMHARIYRLSAWMVFVCVLLLLYIGVDVDMGDGGKKIVSLGIAYGEFMAYRSIRVIIKCDRYVISALVGQFVMWTIVLLGLGYWLWPYYCSYLPIEESLLRAVMAVVLSFPFVYVLLMHGATKQKYFTYVENCLNNELELFVKAKDISEGKCANAADESKKLPPEYVNTFAQLYANKDNADDTRYSELTKAFTSRFQKLCKSPQLLLLVGVQANIDASKKKEEKYVDINTPVNAIEKKSLGETKLELAVHEYRRMKTKPKIKEFCKTQRIDFAAFMTEYHKQQS